MMQPVPLAVVSDGICSISSITGRAANTLPGGFSGNHEVSIMARKTPNFYNPKLSAAENRAVNGMIRRSWKNGREAGRKATFAQLYSSNRIKEGTR